MPSCLRAAHLETASRNVISRKHFRLHEIPSRNPPRLSGNPDAFFQYGRKVN